MTIFTKRMGLAFWAGLVALGVSAGAWASVHNTNRGADPFMWGGPGGSGGSGQASGSVQSDNQGRRGRFGGPGQFGGPGALGGRGGLGMLLMLARELDLTDVQKDQIRRIGEAHRDEWRALADRARAARDALNDAIAADTVNDALIRAKAADMAAVDADMAVTAAHVRAEAWQVLTPEQQAKAKQLQAEARNRRERRGR
jgi:Spy/CpxP family protein refolding chaperone